MRRLIKLALIALGIRAFMHWRKSRKEAQATSPAAAPAADPADELRQKLADSREDGAPDEVPETPTASVADRRAEVHDHGRATLDEMKSSDEG